MCVYCCTHVVIILCTRQWGWGLWLTRRECYRTLNKKRIYYHVIIHLYIRWRRVVYEIVFANSEHDGDLWHYAVRLYECILRYYYVGWFIEHATLSFSFNNTVIQDVIFEILLKVNNNYILKFLRFELLKECFVEILTSVFWNYLFYYKLLQNIYDFDVSETRAKNKLSQFLLNFSF